MTVPTVRRSSRPAPRPYRVLVTGSRTWPSAAAIFAALDALAQQYPGRLVVVLGACPTGADNMAELWANAAAVRVERYPADWATHGRRAGRIRNAAMVASAPDECLAFIRNDSPGATHCAALAEATGIPTTYYRRNDP